MTWEPRPLPEVTPETRPFWEGCAEGRLFLNECQFCGHVYHYPRAHCPDCFGRDINRIEADGEGTIYSYSTARQIAGWPDDDLPLVVAYVELSEGPRILTNIVDVEPQTVSVGTPVAVKFEETAQDDIAVPVFTSVE